MADQFDAYYKWLGIPPEEQPPHYYRLLGVRPLEADLDVIANAADQRMSHLRTFQSGKNAAASQKLLNEIAAARLCLLSAAEKAKYDRGLQNQLNAQAARPPALPPAPLAAPPPAAFSPSPPANAPLPNAGPDPVAPPAAVGAGASAGAASQRICTNRRRGPSLAHVDPRTEKNFLVNPGTGIYLPRDCGGDCRDSAAPTV